MALKIINTRLITIFMTEYSFLSLRLRHTATLLSIKNPQACHYSSDIGSLNDVAAYLKSDKVKNLVVMAGAGISTASGIPDFRSPGSGVYDNIQKYEEFKLPYPEAVFDIEYFHHKPEAFFRFAKELYPTGNYRPNHAHYFIRLLSDKNKLLRLYTQNIDGLERLAGIPNEKLVEAHGTFHTAKCVKCHKKYFGKDIKKDIFNGIIPKCERCSGVIKPDIVFFGEMLPKKFYLHERDMPLTDFLLIMGTSLEVQPFAGISGMVRFGIPRVLFNMEAAGPFIKNSDKHDYFVQGDLIYNIKQLAELTGWSDELKELVSSDVNNR